MSIQSEFEGDTTVAPWVREVVEPGVKQRVKSMRKIVAQATTNRMKQHNYNKSLPPNKYNPLSWISPEAVIGENVWIGSDVHIGANVEIGDNVSIACGCKIYDHDTSWCRASEGRIEARHYKVKIGRCTEIGSNTVVLPGAKDVTIGDHCIVGALSLVKRDIPAYSVAVGCPARVVRHINDDVIKEMCARFRGREVETIIPSDVGGVEDILLKKSEPSLNK